MILQTSKINQACSFLETEARYLKEMADGFFKIGQRDTALILDLRVKHINEQVGEIRKAQKKQEASLIAIAQANQVDVLADVLASMGSKPASKPSKPMAKPSTKHIKKHEYRYMPHEALCASCIHVTVHESWDDEFKATCDMAIGDGRCWPRASSKFGELCDEYSEHSNG